ncbi:MAG: DUF4126 domain-containing protein [Candidatus Acidiferrales bacterium]|jgi:uncharacterized protein DUF4126
MNLAAAIPMIPTGNELTALLVVVCFSAGLNVYATVAMLGILGRFNVLAVPPGLHVVQDWKIITACCVLFALEFVGDKIPIFDLIWNAAHTFVRVPVAALIAYGATAQLPQWEQIAATFAGGLIALAAHGGKTAARAAVTSSPEPFSNFALSAGEDALVVFLMWFATQHPYVSAGIVAVGLLIILLLLRFVVRSVRNLLRDAENALTHNPPGTYVH